MAFALYLVAVGFYVTFLAWCLLPIVRGDRRSWTKRARVAAGLLLLAGNIIPILLFPVRLAIALAGGPVEEYASAVLLFARTLPTYVQNVQDRSQGSAWIVEIRYPIEIGGLRYAPIVRTACVYRRMWAFDKGVTLKLFERYPTPDREQFLVRAGDAIVALAHSRAICSDVLRGPVNLDRLQQQRVFVIRGEADKTQFYSLERYPSGRLEVHDIALDPPELVSITEAPAQNVVPLDAMWPMLRAGAHEDGVPGLAWRYITLPAGVNACVNFVSWDSFAKPPQVREWRKTSLPKGKEASPRTYCADVLSQHIEPVDGIRELTPLP